MLGNVIKNERHPSRSDLHQSARAMPSGILRTRKLVEMVHRACLFISSGRGITTDVNKKNVRDLQAQLRFRFLRHKIHTSLRLERLKRFVSRSSARVSPCLGERLRGFDAYIWSFAGLQSEQQNSGDKYLRCRREQPNPTAMSVI